jgi:hypothetical protein
VLAATTALQSNPVAPASRTRLVIKYHVELNNNEHYVISPALLDTSLRENYIRAT